MKLLPLLLISLPAFGISFPEISGKLHNPAGLNLKKLSLTVTVECDDPKTGPCGSEQKKGEWDESSGTFTLPSLKPAVMEGMGMYQGYHKPGWGKRFDYRVAVALTDGDLAIAHDLVFWAWESRPGFDLATLLQALPLELSHLTLFHAPASSTLILSPVESFAGRSLKFRLQKYFYPLDGGEPDIARSWHTSQPPKPMGEAKEVRVEFPPMAFLIRGAPEKYGTSPNMRTLIHVYRIRPGSPKLDFLGFNDVKCPFSETAVLGAKEVTIVSEKP